MSKQNGQDSGMIEVSDDEQYTDKKIKQRILNAREQLNEVQNELYSARLVDPDVDYTEIEALMAWGNLVRSFIRDISVLLRHDDVEDSQFYREEVELGQVRLVPQDVEGYPFSKIAYDEMDASYLKRQMGLTKGVELPQPETIQFQGLMDLVERENYVERRWVVVTNPKAPKPAQEYVETYDRQPIPKQVYERALMAADQFLQGVGVGLDISAEDYMGGEEPGL